MGCGCKCGSNTCSWIYDCCCCPTCPPCGCISTTSSETCLNGVTYYYYSTSAMQYYSFKFSEVIFVPNDDSSQSTNQCIQQFMQMYYSVPSGYTFSQTAPSNLSSMTNQNSGCVDQAQGCYMWQNNVSENYNDNIFSCQCTSIPCSFPSNGCIYS